MWPRSQSPILGQVHGLVEDCLGAQIALVLVSGATHLWGLRELFVASLDVEGGLVLI